LRSARYLFLGLEGLVIIATSIATGIGYHLVATGEAGDVCNFTIAGLLVAALYSVILNAHGLYEPTRFMDRKLPRNQLLASWATHSQWPPGLRSPWEAGSDYSRGHRDQPPH